MLLYERANDRTTKTYHMNDLLLGSGHVQEKKYRTDAATLLALTLRPSCRCYWMRGSQAAQVWVGLFAGRDTEVRVLPTSYVMLR